MTLGARDVAIIGMACRFPGATDLASYWKNIVTGVDAIGDPPEDWGADLVFDPHSVSNDRVYCQRGGFLRDLDFDAAQYGVMPNSVDGAEPDHFLTLALAHHALADAGYGDAAFARDRTEVILGRGEYFNRGNVTALQHGMIVEQTLRVLKALHPETPDAELARVKAALKASLPPFTSETAPGLVPNVVCGRVANRLDLMGANFTVDAACASSLIALDLGARDLLERRCDVAIVGGVHASTPPIVFMVFCLLNALSRKGQIRPFDRGADGTLLGEGLGLIVLKRAEDAIAAGDRIYAVVKAVGVASDGRALGVLAPRVEGEELAIRRAYQAAGVDPSTVDLIEAHGTATPVGDATEVQALKRVFADGVERPRCAIGSVKSMIGHTMPAAGIAGVIKAAMALHHRIIPPSLHCEEPNPALGLGGTPFYVNTEALPWVAESRVTPRRAGVNAFGFGGINTHAILEEAPSC